ncbi:MAG: hypothetical protein K5790_05880 [Nitrosopumilus sp.]|uniref:hypothetical protein n=1 Tax=Nitrosopumilus sp. TaxID=2024843 RepID=UPI00247CE155|nr:hypothetical protein [Nitrosopumilus sp.]MCV0392810.1 hypothetical protein [Nitrosopumilus sp.]
MGDAKIKVNLKEGTVELEGSEEFVKSYWEKISNSLKNMPVVHSTEPLPTIKPKQNSSPKKKSKQKQKKINLSLIPLDLKEKDNRPSFSKFFEEKCPKSNQEIVTVIAYYLKHYLNIPVLKYGHALFCYNEIKKPKPLNIVQLFRDTVFYKKWLTTGKEVGTVELSIAGENLVEHDLPAKEVKKK